MDAAKITKVIIENWPKISPQSILAVLGIIAVLFSLIKIFWPKIKLKVVSLYYTFDVNHKLLVIMKLQTISNVDLILEAIAVNVTFKDSSTLKMIPFAVRWKAVIFKMLDMKKQERDFKLLKPLEPNLRIQGIKQGSNECYVCMKSTDISKDMSIQSWSFELKCRHHFFPVPNLSWFNKKSITVIQPEGKALYFDDSLFKKITPEERQKIMDEL